MREYGRKPTLIYSNVPWIIGWILLSSANNFWIILLGTVFVGFSSGFNNNAVLVYTIEITEPKLRGFFASFLNVLFSTGIFVGHFLGITFSWRTALGLYAIFPAIALISGFFLPESPNWLIIKGRVEEASTIFTSLRGIGPASQQEYDILLEKRSKNAQKHDRGIIKNIFSEKFVRPCVIMTVMFTIGIGCGIHILVFYAVDVLEQISPTMDTSNVLNIINVVRCTSALLSTILIRRLRRKSLYFFSAFGTILFLIAIILAIHYKLSDQLLVLSLCFYIGMATIGVDQISWIMIAEVSHKLVYRNCQNRNQPTLVFGCAFRNFAARGR